MIPDPLDRAVRAYRSDLGRGESHPAETLGRILESHKRHRPLRPMVWIAALTCSAMAAAAIHETPRIRGRHASSPAVAATARSAEMAPMVASPKERVARSSTAMIAPSVSSVPPAAPAPAPVVAVSARRSAPVRRQANVPGVESAPDEARGPNDPEDTLFEEVQRDHRSASTADDLAGWQRYLAAYPDGRFAPEARYRRAEALARLGDENAALAAFLWFAHSPDGASRREDALRWVRALTAER